MTDESEPHTVNTTNSSSTSSNPSKIKQSQVPGFSGFPTSPNGDIQMFPIMYPMFVPGLVPMQNREHNNRGAGIYAVPVLPFGGSVTGLPPNALIPLTYNIPTGTSQTEGAAAVTEGHGQDGQHHHGPQRHVVIRRFHFAFQLDLLLILKLAAVIFVFNQDGSKQRLFLLVFFAIVVYLYQTGALTPLIRWLSQGMHRPIAPPQPRPAARADNAAIRPEDENAARADGVARGDNLNQGLDNENRPAENENQAVPARADGGNWWGIVREVQMIVVGFITSLLPGFHNVD